MAGGISRSQVTVAVNNDKTGYSLTAGSYSVVRSTQRRTMTISSGSSGTSTLSPTLTDTAKAALRMLGFSLGQTTYADPSHDFVRIEITNTTTVTANVASNVSATITISYEITEYY